MITRFFVLLLKSIIGAWLRKPMDRGIKKLREQYLLLLAISLSSWRQETSQLICIVINWLVSIWWGHYSYMGGRTFNVFNIFRVSLKLQHYIFIFIYNRHSAKARVFAYLKIFHLGSTDTSCETNHRRNNTVP